ncbi:MAG: porin family protein [Bernardetiaceae bacterium]
MVFFRHFLLAISLLFFSQLAVAQDFHFGTKLGLNLASFSTDLSAQSAVGFHVGTFASVELGKFGVRPELMVSTKGGETTLNFKRPLDNADAILKSEINLWYLDFPVLLEYKVLPFMRLQAGPQLSLLITDEVTNSVVVAGQRQSVAGSLFDFESLDVGLAVGVGFNFLMFDMGLRYNVGLATVSELSNPEFLGNRENYDLRNGVFQVSLGYRFK